MDSNLLRLAIVILALGAMAPVAVAGQDVRVAVLGDPSLANLVDVTTAALSGNLGFVVLERADLDKLGQEQALQSMVTAEDLSAASLVPAEGLVLLRAVNQDGKAGVFARLVAVQPGVVLREVALPAGTDPTAQAQVLKTELAPYWSKLETIRKGKIRAISLLGLRFEMDVAETRDLERRFNILLASRLSAEPDVLVLERWRLNDAVFEKVLTPQQPSPFWTGSSLIDGSMRWDKSSSRIAVTLRVRPPHGTDVSIEDGDTTENLPALIERLAGKIRGGASTVVTWTPVDEARHFADLGKWCLDNGLADEGAGAIESALALGDTSRSTRMLQIKAYAMEAYPDDLHVVHLLDEFRAVIPPDSVDSHLKAACLAAVLMHDYLRDNPDVAGQAPDQENPVDWGVPVLCNCLHVLRVAYDNGLRDSQSDSLAELRHDIQKLIADLDSRLLPQPISRTKRAYFRQRDGYAGLWHETPEEAVAFYRENLSPKMYGSDIRVSLYQYDALHPPFLDEDTMTDQDQEGHLLKGAPEFRDTPYIVAWDGRSKDDVRAVWRKFLDELAASSDPVLQADALKLELKSTVTDARRNDCVARFVVFMQQHSDLLSAPRSKPFVAGIDNFFTWTQRRDNADARAKLTALYLSQLQKKVNLPPAWIEAGRSFLYGGDKVTTEEAQELLSALDDYTKWYGSRTPLSVYDQQVLRALGETRQIFFRAKPELTPETVQINALPVTRFWNGSDQVIGMDVHVTPRLLFVGPETVTAAENHIWFMTQKAPYRVFAVDPVTLQIVSTYAIPDDLIALKSTHHLNIQSLDVSPQWVAVGVDDRFFLCSRADGRWRELDLPPFIYKPRFVNQELYLLYRSAYDPRTSQPTSAGSGLIHVKLPGGEIENVISSRRVPPQTALDGKPLGFPLDLWMSEAGLTLAVGTGTYATPMGKNAWAPLTSTPGFLHVRLTSEGALIGVGKTRGFFAQLNLVGASGSTLLLSAPTDTAQDNPGKPLWNLPDELGALPPAEIEQVSPIMRSGDLILYQNLENGVKDGKQACLYYFARGQKKGMRIPLAFDVETLKSLRPLWRQIPTPGLNFGGLQATDFGVVIYGVGDPGFWVIPWSDIDAYRAKALPISPTSP